MKKRTFFNIGVITGANIIVRLMGVVYKIWLAKAISPVALGIYQLSMSVYMFFITPIASGLPNGVSRLCAKYRKNPKDVVKSGIKCAAVPIIFSCIIMFFGKNIIARIFLHEENAYMTVVSLIPAISLGAFASLPAGYYHAKEKSSYPAVFEIIEQFSKIVFAFILVKSFSGKNDYLDACIPALAVSFGGTVSFILMFLPIKLPKKAKNDYSKELLQNAIPPTLSRMATSVLHLCTTTVLPLRLISFGLTKETALSQYGILTSMAYPVVFMPMTLIGALAVVLLPKIAGNLNNKKYVTKLFYENLFIAFLVSVIFSLLLLMFAPYASNKIYSQPVAGRFMVMLIPSVLFLGPKMICATMINGLGRQKILMILSVADGIAGLILTYILVGKFGIYGFIFGNCIQDISAFLLHFILCKKLLRGMKKYENSTFRKSKFGQDNTF